MRGLRKQVGVLTIAALSVAGGFFGYNAIENVQFARAADEVQATRQQLGTVEDMSTVFRQVGKVVEPSVVNINVTKKIPGMGGRMHMFDEDQLRRMFPNGELPRGFHFRGGGGNNNNNGNNNGDGSGSGDDDSAVEVGTGSGVIMEVAGGYGYIMTNNHVAGGAEKMTITLADGRQIEDATLVGADPKSDIAVVKIKADRLIPAKWGNSDELQKGDWIMAFGSPLGYVGSMTHGIVSALHRNAVGIIQNGAGYENFIQVDAPINPGNSGGPLVNIRGEVVGVNTAIASRSGGFEGIGFAVPSNQARVVYDALKAHGKMVRGYLGVAIKDVSAEDPGVVESFGFKGTKGAVVHEISPSGPAEGKLHEGDIITAVNGKQVADSQELRNAIADVTPDSDAKLSVFHDGKTKDIDITIAVQPADMAAALRGGPTSNDQGNTANGEAAPDQTFGMTLETLNNDLATQAGVTNVKKGAIVTDVEANSPAAKKGIRPGDVITRIGNQSVTSAAEATDALEKADHSKGIRLFITNSETTRFVILKPMKSSASKSNSQ